jgi:hypothetical protein
MHHRLGTRNWSALVAFSVSLVVVGCSKKDDGGKPSSVPAMDPSAQPAAPPSAPAAAPPASAAAPGSGKEAAPAATGGSISGRIVLPPKNAKLKPTKGSMFLIARRPSDNPSIRGTLIAVKKLPVTTFPLPFTLSAADMPFQNGAFDGEMALSVRIDQDNDPMSRQKGDLFGVLPKVQVGSKDVVLSLDQVQTEAESLAQPGAHGPGMGAPPPAGHP